MYLPKSLQIASPYISFWYGQSGRQYEFGVVRSSSFRIDEPAVYLLVRHEGDMMVPLSVGQTEGGRTGPDGGTPAEWVQALSRPRGVIPVVIDGDLCRPRGAVRGT
jgi:hypothetical protein